MSETEIIAKIYDLIMRVEEGRHEHIADELQDRLLAMGVENISSLSIMECHVIDYIGNNKVTNAISIARHLKITRGGISKMSQRLIRKGLIDAERIEGNRREIFYHLTPLGEKIYIIHASLHKKVEEALRHIIERYSETEKITINNFLDSLAQVI